MHLMRRNATRPKGCGTGLVVIAARALGASSVVLTDIGEVLKICEENVALNESRMPQGVASSPIAVRQYYWGSKSSGLASQSFDVVLIADCILPKLYPVQPLVEAIDDLLGPAGLCLVSYEHRTWFKFDPRERFFELCSERGLSVEAVKDSDMDDKYRGEDIVIWEVRRRAPGGDTSARIATPTSRHS